MKCQPEQDAGNTPAKYGKDVPAGPQYSHVPLAKQCSPLGWNHSAFAKAPKDETLPERGVNEPDDECQDCGGKEVRVQTYATSDDR